MQGAAGSEAARRQVLRLPPGYHFRPTDEELVVAYLRNKIDGRPLPLPIFIDENVIGFHPEKLVDRYREYGEERWFFFTKRERKYANGSRPNRTTPGNGHWKATGSQREIRSHDGTLVGLVRTLVFYEGAAADGCKEKKTVWTMYEYENVAPAEEGTKPTKLGEWVLCSIQKKQRCEDRDRAGGKRKRKRPEAQPAEPPAKRPEAPPPAVQEPPSAETAAPAPHPVDNSSVAAQARGSNCIIAPTPSMQMTTRASHFYDDPYVGDMLSFLNADHLNAKFQPSTTDLNSLFNDGGYIGGDGGGGAIDGGASFTHQMYPYGHGFVGSWEENVMPGSCAAGFLCYK